MFSKVLIANRGEIAVRVIRACRELGIATVAVHSTVDRDALHVALADERVCIGPASPDQSYASIPALLTAAVARGVDAVHPGYGFLSENGDFAEACERSGITFIGPRVRHIRLMGDKPRARRLVAKAGVPVLPGSGEALSTLPEARAAARAIGYPVLVKAAAGGGGRGMRVAAASGDLAAAFTVARAEGQAAFGNDRVYVERYVPRARHVEVQVVGDRQRAVLHLGERDCSIQRRRQKVLEEAPAPGLAPRLRTALVRAAVRAARAVGYGNVGTVEFLLDPRGRFWFIEMNTRIQVEHPVTEAVTGIDVVVLGIRVAAGLPLAIPQRAVRATGHALECRIVAEDPDTHLPAPGVVRRFHAPGGMGVRVETGIEAGSVVPAEYDSLLAKVIAWAPTRAGAIARMRGALAELRIEGVPTNVALHARILEDPTFLAGGVPTTYLADLERRPDAA